MRTSRRTTRALVAALALDLILGVLAVLLTPVASTAAAAPAVLSGRVTSPSGAGIAGVYVEAYVVGRLYPLRDTETASDGTWSLSLPPGRYQLKFDPVDLNEYADAGWQSEWYGDTHDRTRSPVLTLAAGQQRPGLDADLARGGQIRGVVDLVGDDPQTVSVVAIPVDLDAEFRGDRPVADGRFWLNGLQDGRYRVKFSLDYRDERHLSRYLGGAARLADAQVVTIASGQIVDAGTVTLPLVGTIRGTLTEGDAHHPAANRAVTLEAPPGDPEFDDIRSFTVRTDARGRYVVHGVDSLPYVTRFEGAGAFWSEWYRDSYSRSAATPVMGVAAAEVTGIDANLERGGTVHGRAVFPPGTLDFVTRQTRLIDATTGGWVAWGAVADDGSYSFRVPPGTFRVGLAWVADRLAGHAFTVDMRNGRALTLPTYRIRDGGTLSGTLLTQGGKPMRCRVRAYTRTDRLAAREAWSSGSTGRYTISGLATGSYRLEVNGDHACRQGVAPRYYDAEAPSHTTAVEADSDGVPTTEGRASRAPTMWFGDLDTFADVPTPTVSGTPAVGQRLTAVPGDTTPAAVAVSYQWFRGTLPIAGATRASYVPAAGDRGKNLSVRVTFAKPGYAPALAFSAKTRVG